MKEIPILILAAGASSRLGRPKQLLERDEINFLQFSIQEATKSSKKVYLVLGSQQEIILKNLSVEPARWILNPDWEEGMASSIRCGLQWVLEEDPHTEALMIMVCDQPFADALVFNRILQEYRNSQSSIIASEYQNTLGTPVLFNKVYFKDLLLLKGSAGAKKLVLENKDQVLSLPFPLGYLDIDTQEDFEAFKIIYNSQEVHKN